MNDKRPGVRGIISLCYFSELYKTYGRIRKNQATPRQMLKLVIYAAMNRIYSSRDIRKAWKRAITKNQARLYTKLTSFVAECEELPFLKDMESHLGFKYSEIAADAGYESEENYLFIAWNRQKIWNGSQVSMERCSV